LYDVAMTVINCRAPTVLIKKDEKYIGTVSSTDIVRHCILRGMDPEIGQPQDIFVPKHQTATAQEGTSLSNAVMIMEDKNASEIVVVNDNGEPQGVLALIEIAKYLID